MSQTACNFSPSTRGFSASMANKGFFSSKEVLRFHKPHVSLNTRLFLGLALTGFFSLLRFLLFCKHADYPILGVRDMSQVSTYVLSKTKVKTMFKWGTRTPYKSKVSFRYFSSQVPRRSWDSLRARPRHLARPGGLDKTMTTSETKSSGKTKINHDTNLQSVTVSKRVVM